VDGENVIVLSSEQAAREHLRQLGLDEAKDFLEKMYFGNGRLYCDYDDGRFLNHSKAPNVGGCGDVLTVAVALRDIAAGEELTEDYELYDYPDWVLGLYKEYDVSLDYIEIPKDSPTSAE
jgi:hypothetical protein